LTIKKEKKELSSFNKVRYILELEGEICSRDDVVPRVRQIIYELKKETTMEIFSEVCICENNSRLHLKYIYDWAS
jgi:hypothetical protein